MLDVQTGLKLVIGKYFFEGFKDVRTVILIKLTVMFIRRIPLGFIKVFKLTNKRMIYA